MGDQIRIPHVELTYFFLHYLSIAIFKTAELPALCDAVSAISQLFVPHFALSAFTCIYLQHRKIKQLNVSFVIRHSVQPRSSVGRVTVDLIRRSWVRFPPRSKEFFFASCGSLIPFTRANAQWVFHGLHIAFSFTLQS